MGSQASSLMVGFCIIDRCWLPLTGQERTWFDWVWIGNYEEIASTSKGSQDCMTVLCRLQECMLQRVWCYCWYIHNNNAISKWFYLLIEFGLNMQSIQEYEYIVDPIMHHLVAWCFCWRCDWEKLIDFYCWCQYHKIFAQKFAQLVRIHCLSHVKGT